MSEIEVGEYVRLDDGTIGKFLYNNGSNYVYEVNEEQIEESSGIINHSKNIIDLIEVGDYVNGCLVIEISRHRKTFTILSKIGLQKYEFEMVRKGTVKAHTIVTKEIFERESYKVGK